MNKRVSNIMGLHNSGFMDIVLRYSLFVWVVFFGLIACTTTEVEKSPNDNNQLNVEHLAIHYFNLFAKRQQFDEFIEMYAEDAVLQDIVYGQHVAGKAAIRGFYRWDSGDVNLLTGKTLNVVEQHVSERTVITRGVFEKFEYHDQTLGPWRFVIWQEFDDSGLIVRQYDWINYTPKTQFIDGENLNVLQP